MTRGHSTVDGAEVLDHDELEDGGEMSSVTQRVAFDTENTVVIHARIAGVTTSNRHHYGDYHDYGYVIDGHVALEFGPGGRETLDAYAGDFIRVDGGDQPAPQSHRRGRGPARRPLRVRSPVVDVEEPVGE